MKIRDIILRAQRLGRVKDNLVLCDNCDTPASKSISVKGPVLCAPCALGEADAFDASDVITVQYAGAKR